MLVWMVVEELYWLLYFGYITFFNIYYVNLSVVRNIPLLHQARQQPAKAVSWLKFEPWSQTFPVKESYLILLL